MSNVGILPLPFSKAMLLAKLHALGLFYHVKNFKTPRLHLGDTHV
jgi:uncharacterized protein (DUF697 family)